MMKGYIQPFERRLALEELRALAGGDVVPVDGDADTARTFSVESVASLRVLREMLAYWWAVGDTEDGLTFQVLAEATAGALRRGKAESAVTEAEIRPLRREIPRRRCLRYATHGIHEYRGKFFPQLTRALMNVAGVAEGGNVVDPMCGSGTALVEAILSGRRYFGLDMNPLSVLISSVKCEALEVSIADFEDALQTIEEAVNREPGSGIGIGRSDLLSDQDRRYLERWFSPQVLSELDHIELAIRNLRGDTIRNFFYVCLSNILRDVSWQKNEDLRVRREVSHVRPGETTERFLMEAVRSTKTLIAFLSERGSTIAADGCFVRRGDARHAVAAMPEVAGKADVVITSPPYATALPYIDTDRLSLIYLGLLPRDSHRNLDAKMIGNREVTRSCRDRYWVTFQHNKSLIPKPTCQMIERVDELNRSSNVGFRRQNMSALLSKYFFDMRKTIQQIRDLLKPGCHAFLVVGNNRTIAGGEMIEIRTADHLVLIAEDAGLRLVDRLSMEMLVPRGIFRKNAVSSEQIIRLEKS